MFQSLLSWNTDLGKESYQDTRFAPSCFNPCYRGILIWGQNVLIPRSQRYCFNPCYRGILIWGNFQTKPRLSSDDRFNPCYRGILIWGRR